LVAPSGHKVGNERLESQLTRTVPKMVESEQVLFDLSQELVFSGKSWNSINGMDKLSVAVLLFQNGYLTMKEVQDKARLTYRLDPSIWR
jgi:hypothetical protein